MPTMGSRRIERRLRQIGARLRSLRGDLHVADEQLLALADEADDMSIRSLVAETSGAGLDARRAQGQADAMARHRAHVAAEIARLEAEQDQLLDQLTAGRDESGR